MMMKAVAPKDGHPLAYNVDALLKTQNIMLPYNVLLYVGFQELG